MVSRLRRATFAFMVRLAMIPPVSKLLELRGVSWIGNHLYTWFMRNRISSQPVTIGGIRMYVDQGGWGSGVILALKGTHEDFETRVFESLLHDGDVLVDIGAGIGYYALVGARLVGRAGKVYAFEPEPGNYALLSRNVRLNNFDNVIPVQKAIAERTGGTDLFLSSWHKSGHSTVERTLRQRIRVETDTLDAIFPRPSRVDVIKMDIEGAEGLALKGAAELLASSASLALLMEFTPQLLERSGFPPQKLLSGLVQQGFALYEIDEASRRLKPSDALLAEKTRHRQTNVLLLKNRKPPDGLLI